MTRKTHKDEIKKKFSFSSLNTQIFFYVILPLSLLLLAITFGSISLHQDAMRNLVGERDQRTARSAASALREQLYHRASAIQNIAIRTSDGNSLKEILNSVEFLMDDFDVGIGFYSADGRQIDFNGDADKWAAIDDEITILIRQLSPEINQEPIFSEPFQANGTDEFFTLVLFQSSSSNPIAVGIFSIANLARGTLSGIIASSNQGSVVLVDQKNNLLFQSGNLDLIQNPLDHPGIIEALSGESGTTYFQAEGGEHVVAFSSVLPTNWALVIEEPWDTVASPLLRYSETGSLILVPIVVFALFALWFGTRKIIQPLNRLQNQSISFTQGNFDAFKKPVGGINEIETLHSIFAEMADEVQNAQQTLKKYLAMITDSQEDERKRLARELHDETLQSLIALNQRVMMVGRQAEKVGLKDALEEIETMIGQTMKELRRLTRALRPIYLEDLGLVTALETLSAETRAASKIRIEFEVEGVERRLPDNVEIALFRISQEALSNIMRHSEATNALVSITFKNNEVELMISDNGKGFSSSANSTELSKIGHFGLLGMQERAELIGGKFNIHSNTDQGTQLILQIPS